MSTLRKAKRRFNESGRCSWCGTYELPPERRLWCSMDCVEAYKMLSDPGYVRRLVYKRDRGICALCGCDSDAEYRRWKNQAGEIRRLASRLAHASRWDLDWVGGRWVFRDSSFPDYKAIDEFGDRLREKYCVSGNWTAGRSSGWDADHIVPVVEGGGECDLENYRTLCHPCHKIVTANLAARLAERRRIERRAISGDLFPET